MTISTTSSRISYNGNGVTTIFAVPFRFFANTDLVVQLVTISTGASSTLTLTTNYTITGADDEGGGSLTMLVAPAVGQRLVIRRVIAATQEVDYVAGDPFPAETHERALDRLTMLAQQGEEVNARALVFPSGDTASGELPAVASRANRLIGFDAAGNLVTSAPASGSAAELALSLAGTGGAGLVGLKRAIASAADLTVSGWVESQTYCTSDFSGIVPDGVTDNSAAFSTIIGLLPEGSTLRIKGLLRIASTLNITRRIGLWCEDAGDAILVDVGTANDGVVYTGPASGINNITIKLNVYGRNNACKDAVVLSRVDRSPNIDINVHAGAVEHAVSLNGCLINKIKIDSSVNYQPPISSPGFQAKHIRIKKALGVAFNANDLYVNLEGGGAGIVSDDMTSEGDNKISGTIEGLTTGRPLDLNGWLGGHIADLHLEANSIGPRVFNCSHITVGPNVVNADAETPFEFENCRQPRIDGYYGDFVFDANCFAPRIGRVLASSNASISAGSYFASSEVEGSTAYISTVDSFYGGPGSFTLENLFHNPFMDVWTDGYFSAPDGCALVNATCQVFTYPAPTYTSISGKSCEVNVTGSAITDGFYATCKEPYNKGQQNGHYVSAMVAIYVASGQPDVNVYILASGQFLNIGRVTAKNQWVEVRGGARCSPGGDDVQVHVVPWNFTTSAAVPGKFVIGGLSVVQGVRAPRHLCNHGKREAHIAHSIVNAPAFIGQRAYLAGTSKWYMAGGTAAPADWLMLN